MKLALISDLHSRESCLKYLDAIVKNDKTSAVVCCGDITVADDLPYLERLFDILEQNDQDGFFVWGNSDEQDVQKTLQNSQFNVHLKKRKFDKFNFFGLSYMEDYPFFDTTEIRGSILITHQPPLQANLDQARSNAPLFHISGHLHKKAFVKSYSTTTHIQVPTLMDGAYGIFDTGSSKTIFKHI